MFRLMLACAFAVLAVTLPAAAKNSGFIYITNEKSSTLTVINLNNEVVKSVKTCARPRGMIYHPDRTKLIIACGKRVGRIRAPKRCL